MSIYNRKKFYNSFTILLIFYLILFFSIPISAQQFETEEDSLKHYPPTQLPNWDFEQEWVTCQTWNSDENGKYTTSGQTPNGWNVSNIGAPSAASVSNIGASIEGYLPESKGVQISNQNKTVLVITKTIPGYITLGTPWSTSEIQGLATPINKDGGTWGGVGFNNRPDKISFYYKSTGSIQPTFVFYLWKGNFIQTNVPGSIVTSALSKASKVSEMINRDIVVLNRPFSNENLGDKDISYRDNAELIAKIEEERLENKTSWEKQFFTIPYLTNSIPEYINVIFAADNYYSTDPTANNSLSIDDVRLIYHSRLENISINGQTISDFQSLNDSTFTTTQSGQLPENPTIDWTYLGQGQSAAVNKADDIDGVVFDPEMATITITIHGIDQDEDGLDHHIYILQYDLPYFSRIQSLTINGSEIEFEEDPTSQYYLIGSTDAPYPTSVEDAKNLIESIVFKECSGEPQYEVSLDEENNSIIITVTNSEGTDIDGLAEHKYRIECGALPSPQLKDIKIEGVSIPNFKPLTLTYTIDKLVPGDLSSIIPVIDEDDSEFLIVTGPTLIENDAKVTIKVSNGIESKDKTYTLQFLKPTDLRIKQLTINGEICPGFDPSVYTQTMEMEYPGAGTVSCEVMESVVKATSKITYDDSKFTVTITLTAPTGAIDLDGVTKQRTYVLTFDAPQTPDQPDDPNEPDDPDDPDDPNEPDDPNDPNNPDVPGIEGTLTVYNGTLTIEMQGQDLTEGGQPASVEIEEYGDGTATFRLPDFTLNLDGDEAKLGDIVVENVTVTENDGIRTYTGEVKGMQLAGGEIIADVTLNGTVDVDLFAHMVIEVLWEGIPINVEFNGQGEVINDGPAIPDGDWTIYNGIMTIDMNGYDITEGGEQASLRIMQNADGTYNLLLPDFSMALDIENENITLGNILVENVPVSEIEGVTSFNGSPTKMTFIDGTVVTEISVHGTLDTNGDIRVFVDVIWEVEDGRRIPFIVKFTDTDDNFMEYRISHFRGILTTKSEDDIPVAHNITVIITPESKGRVHLEIQGINFPAYSRATSDNNSVYIPGVSVGKLTGGLMSYDGAASGLSIQSGVTIDMTLHGHTLSDGTLRLSMNMDWAEKGTRLAGTYEGYGAYSDIDSPTVDTPASDSNAEYYDLKGVKVNPNNLRPGIYIRKTANKIEKILITNSH